MLKKLTQYPPQRYLRIGLLVVVLILGGLVLWATNSPSNLTTQATTYSCNNTQMTAEQIAAYRKISLETLQELTKHSVSFEQACYIPQDKIKEALADNDKAAPDKPDEALAWRKLQLKDERGAIPADGLIRAAAHVKAMPKDGGGKRPNDAGISPGAWTWLGPGNIGGRTRSIVIDPTTPATMWLGSVGGGIWKTTNGGTSWQVQDDFMSNMAVATLAISPSDPNTLYAGTGEGFYNGDGLQGAGIFKTTNGGTTWTQLTSTNNSNFYYVNRLSIDPNNANIILAATNVGIFRSTNAGTTWNVQLNARVLDINFHPTNSLLAIAGGNAGNPLYSSDGGLTWNNATGPTGARVEVAYAPSSPNITYASVDNNSGQVWKSTDGGHTYTLVNTGTSYLGLQGWYDNIIWVSPTDPNFVIVGGIDLWRSTDGGVSFTQISQWFSAPYSAHADNHYIIADPGFNGTTNKKVYFGNDGGIYKTDDVIAVAPVNGWQSLNNNLGITQFYSGAGNPTTGTIIGGTQDNGTLTYTTANGPQNWTTPFGGDGGWSAADPTDPNYFYGEYVNLQIHRSTDGGVSSGYIYSGITDVGSSANFIAPFILDPNNPNTMLAGGVSLWRSTNVKAATPSWSAIKGPGIDYISAIAVAPGNSDIIWIAQNNGDVYYTTNGTAGSPTWTRRDTTTPALPNRYVTRITIDPTDATKVYVTFGGFSADNVWRTTDSGANWSDITGVGATSLPDVPVRSLVIHPFLPNWLYVGTEIGVFTTTDGGVNWKATNDGPTNTSVDELFWVGTTLVSATHGRGMFKVTPATSVVFLSGSILTVSDAAGNNNGIIEPGETISLQIKLTNNGTIAANNVSGTLAVTGGTATMGNATSAYPNIASSGGTGTNTTNYTFTVGAGQPCGNTLSFQQVVNYTGGSYTYNFTLPTGIAQLGAVQTYTYSGSPVAIPDNTPAGADASIVVPTTGKIGDVNVTVSSITHTYVRALQLRLVSPANKTVILSDQHGIGGTAYTNTVFDDEASTLIANGTAPFTGNFKPDQPLSAVDGDAINGTWKLNVADLDGFNDTGAINGWSLAIQPLTYTCTGNPPVIASLSPSSAPLGGSGFTLTVNGSNFKANSVVQWNGVDRTTTYLSTTQLTIQVAAGDLTSATNVAVKVINDPPSGLQSNTSNFTVTASCDPTKLVVNSLDGVATTCGTLRNAMQTAANPGDVISFAIPTGSSIPVASSLPALAAGVTMSGACTPTGPAITLNRTGGTNVGITLSSNNYLFGLALVGFGDGATPQLKAPSGGANRLKCVVIKKV